MTAQEKARGFERDLGDGARHLGGLYVLLEETKAHIARIEKSDDPMCRVVDPSAPAGDYGRSSLKLVVPREYVLVANREEAKRLAAAIEVSRKNLADEIAKFGETAV
ncbi:MAG: hypothetical protein ACK51V_00410 [bacterium]|jgi:hypothetical protein|nr:hypothetical protein [Betaproteobacteria bacterium]